MHRKRSSLHSLNGPERAVDTSHETSIKRDLNRDKRVTIAVKPGFDEDAKSEDEEEDSPFMLTESSGVSLEAIDCSSSATTTRLEEISYS
ncbi:hypothetical protein MRB53_039217 [Persea americana]|nr:hypothetical protein MRB53_039217 [Persea americana]